MKHRQLRIGFDVSQTAERMAGCGIVADQFLRHLAEVCPGDTFIPYPVFSNYRHPDFVRATRPLTDNIDARQFGLSWPEIVTPWDQPGPDFAAFLGTPDVVHANNYAWPRAVACPVVYTVYDMSAVEAAQYHTEHNRMVCVNGLFEASLGASWFVAISAASRDRFLHWFPHVPAARVSVVPLAARPSLTVNLPDADVDRMLARFGLEREAFWLAVGTIEPRKNYAALLEAYALLQQRVGGALPPLAIAGLKGWLESSLEPRIKRLGLDAHVQCLGFVEDIELAALYRSCLAFLYPSRYEGFGLPVVEAMACGAPVIVSRSTSLPEVVGDAGWVVDIDGISEYAEAMYTLLTDRGRREAQRAAARARAATFSWTRSAAALRDVYALASETA
ncbi:MAG: glycosyltransferase family 4 protein [Acidimicrobiia bacterium]|nr:glycosyltransferase family 4 protein [Acidimicrobiia bacterium]